MLSAHRQQIGVERALEAQTRRARHNDVAVFAPSYVECAAVELDGGAALGEPPSVGGN